LARRGVAAELELDVGQVHVQEQGRADPAGMSDTHGPWLGTPFDTARAVASKEQYH
jgi:hypothetical protein